MTIDNTPPPLPSGRPGQERTPETLEEAARQFEKILVDQFVEVMTKDLHQSTLSGDDGPAWMGSQRDAQRDMMTDVLSSHLVDAGSLRLSDLLLRQWKQAGPAQPSADDGDPAATNPDVS